MATAGGSYQTIVASVAGDAVIVDYSQTIGDYTSPSSATASSTATDAATNWLAQDTGRFSVASNRLNFDAQNTDQTNNAISRDLGVALSDTAWVMRFKMVISEVTQAAGAQHIRFFVGMCSADSATSATAAQDFLGLTAVVNAGNQILRTADADGIALDSIDDTTFAHSPIAETLYVIIKRLTSTTYSVSFYSDSSYTTLIETQSGTCAATVTGLRYIKVGNGSLGQATSSHKFSGYIDDLQIDDGVTTYATADYSDDFSSFPAANAIDGTLTNAWKSAAGIGNAIYFDMGSTLNLCAVAIYLDSANTETQIKIRIDSDTTFADANNVRTITVSGLTVGAWNYIRFPIQSMRYLQIIGSSGFSKVLAINDVKIMTKTDAQLKIEHGHLTIDSSDTLLGLDGT